MKNIKKGTIIAWAVINVILIIATLVVYTKTQEINYLLFCVIINITTAISLVPLLSETKN